MIDISIFKKVRKGKGKRPSSFGIEVSIETEPISEEVRMNITSRDYLLDEESQYKELQDVLECIYDIAFMSKGYDKQLIWHVNKEQIELIVRYSFFNDELLKKFVKNVEQFLK